MHFSGTTALAYVWSALPYGMALCLGLLVPMLAVLCYSNFGVGVAIVVGMFAIEALYMFVGGITVGVSLFYTDFALGMVCAVGLLRLLVAKGRPRLGRAWFVYAIVAALSLATGLATYGSGAGVQARPYFYFTAAALYGMSFAVHDRELRFVFNALAALAALLLCITAYRWVVYYTPITSLLPEEGSYNADGPIRVIRSFETLAVAQVLVVSLFFARASGGLVWLRGLSPLTLAAVLILQHRSVWVSVLVGLFASLFLGRLRRGSLLVQCMLLLALAATIALPVFVSDKLSGVGSQITSSAGNALQERGSAGERLNSWKEIVNNWAAAGPRSILIGQSFGTDPTRYVRDESGGLRKLEYTAHNMYVQTLFNTGLLGLGAFLAAAAYVVIGLYRICDSGRGGLAAQALLVLVLMQLMYYVPYGTDYLQSLIFGVALSYVASQPHVDAKAGARRRWFKGAAAPWGWA